MTKKIETDVLVVGAGISGLATAHFLKKNGSDALILEKEDRAGGSIQSEIKDGFLIEYGPNSTLDTSPILHELFEDVNIESQMEYANEKSNNRYILRDGKLNALPMKPMAFLKTPHFSAGAKLRLIKEPFISASEPEEEENLAQFVSRRLGKEFLDYAIDPFVAGVYAGVPEQLSVKSAFPKLYALEQNYGSILKGTILGARERKKRKETSKQSAKLFSFPSGMQTMISALKKEFTDSLHLNSHIQNITKENGQYKIDFIASGEKYTVNAKNILTTIPVEGYWDLPGQFFTPLLPELKKIESPPVSMVYFGFYDNPASRPLDGFGFLIPRKENRRILGTIWSSTIFSQRAPEGGVALTTFVGGTRQPENALLPEDQLVDVVRKDLEDILGIQKKPDLIEIRVWPKAIPQYNLGHQQIIDEVERFENENPGVYLSGNFRGGISVGDCIKQAKSMAERIMERKRVNAGSVSENAEL